MMKFPKFKHLILFFHVFIFYPKFVFSQNNFWTISGKVIDEAKRPIEFANVYANNTTIGTKTDAKGEFKLKVSNNIPNLELIISFVGQQSLKKKILANNTEEFVFELKNSMLKEVKVTAKKDKNFKKKWEVFKKGLLGDSEFTQECEILNSELINLDYDKKGNVVASSQAPFFIVNKALGYKIMIQMKYLISDGETTYFEIDKFFEKLKPCDAIEEDLWIINRKRAFKNSFRNFLASLVNEPNFDTNFRIFTTNENALQINNIVSKVYHIQSNIEDGIRNGIIFNCPRLDTYYTDEKGDFVLHSGKPIVVYLQDNLNVAPLYPNNPFKFSIISLKKNSISFTKKGWITNPEGLWLYANWGYEGYSTLLPDDYKID